MLLDTLFNKQLQNHQIGISTLPFVFCPLPFVLCPLSFVLCPCFNSTRMTRIYRIYADLIEDFQKTFQKESGTKNQESGNFVLRFGD